MLGIGALLLMCAYAGMVIFAYYDIHGCDPVGAKVTSDWEISIFGINMIFLLVGRKA